MKLKIVVNIHLQELSVFSGHNRNIFKNKYELTICMWTQAIICVFQDNMTLFYIGEGQTIELTNNTNIEGKCFIQGLHYCL